MLARIPRQVAGLISLAMIFAGLVLIGWLLLRVPAAPATARQIGAMPIAMPIDEPEVLLQPTATAASIVALAQDASISQPDPTPAPAVALALAPDLPVDFTRSVASVAEELGAVRLPVDAPTATLRLDWTGSGDVVYREVYAPAARFDTVFPQAESSLVMQLWRDQSGPESTYTRLVVLSDTLPALHSFLSEAGPAVQPVADIEALLVAAWADETTLALLPFDRLTPELVAFAVDGQNPVDNRFDLDAWPFTASVHAHGDAGSGEDSFLAALDQASRGTNRDPERLTVLAMTGVTAMVRQTAWQMDQFGPEWVAEVVGPELAAADITAVSNEVPFVPGCVTNTSVENLTFCSSPDYMAALDAVGADIIGLTGNHQNDYGRADALTSLDIYAEAGLPVYGGGRNKQEAFAPLYVEHNGNRLAFLGANSYGPVFAWATDDGPGSAEFDLNILSATIRAIHEQDRADVVLVELQYQESYGVDPLWDQRQNFRLLSQTGADIVTGIQSHVPQAIEFEQVESDGDFEQARLILYGLGNLFFDQMWRQDTREGLVVKHSFYAGRHISTQILTTLLYDYGQPRWTDGPERESLLRRVFDAGYWPQYISAK